MPKPKAAQLNADLPPNWEARDVQGRIVYINHATRTTQWHKPRTSSKKGSKGKLPKPTVTPVRSPIPQAAPENNSRGSRQPQGASLPPQVVVKAAPREASGGPPPPLPAGWESKIINGNVVYIDHLNQITSFDRPSSPAVAAVAGESDPEKPTSDSVGRSPQGVDRYTGTTPSGVSDAVDSTEGTPPTGSDPYQSSSSIQVKTTVNGAEESPLPPGWGRSVTANEELYYVNHITKSTTWSRPQWMESDGEDTSGHGDGEASAGSPDRSQGYSTEHVPPEPSLPPGWEARMSAEGKVFYINHNDRTTHWIRPEFERPEDDTPPDATSPPNHDHPPPSLGNDIAVVTTDRNHTVPLPSASDDGNGSSDVITQPLSAGKELAEGGGVVRVSKDEELSGAHDTAPIEIFLEEVADASAEAVLASRGAASRAPSATVDTAPVAKPSLALPARPAAVSGPVVVPQSDVSVVSPAAEPANQQERSAAPADRGPVSSIVKSGLFGATIHRATMGGGGGTPNGNALATHVPVYASAQTGDMDSRAAVSAAAGASADGAKEAERELPPLQGGWIELRTPEGKVYYQNSILKATQWTRPVPAGDEASKSPAVPHLQTATSNSTPLAKKFAADLGWEKVATTDGRPYYQNTVTKQTSWNKPADWAEHGAAAASTETAADAQGTERDGAAEARILGGGVAAVVTPRDTFPVANSVHQSEEGEQEAPLPPGWEKLYTDDGVPFWTNHNERTTSWDPPLPTVVSSVVSEGQGLTGQTSLDSSAFESVDESAVGAALGVSVRSETEPTPNLGANGRPLPEGWEMQTTDQGVVYYVDHVSKRTSWDPPLLSAGGSSFALAAQQDIPPAELVPESADLYMGADLLNRFFTSWTGDAQGKSPLEAARNVIVTYLTGPGLKVTKGRYGAQLQRYLYLNPTNKQVVWATKPTSKGKMSKKGLTLDSITELHCENSAVRVEARGEASPLTLKSAALESLTSEGATILLGVLLADMTGTMLKLQGVNGGSGSSYFPAAFVNDVLEVRQARQEKNEAAAAAAVPKAVYPEQSVSSAVAQMWEPAEPVAAPAEAVDAVAEAVPVKESSRAAAPEVSGASAAAATGVADARYPASSLPSRPAVGATRGVAAFYVAHLNNGSSCQHDSDGIDGAVRSGGVGSPIEPTTIVSTGYHNKPEVASSGTEGEEDLVGTPMGSGRDDLASPMKHFALTTAAAESEPPAVAAVEVAPQVDAVEVEEPMVVAEAPKVEACEEVADVGVKSAGTVEVAAAVPAAVKRVVVAVEEEIVQDAVTEEDEEDEETREYREVLTEMLRPVKLEKYVDNFLSSGITLDILPLVERKDLESEVGIGAAVPQLKIMRQIKKRFPDGI